MGANPMQKMKRNSILTGLIIGLVIGLILCVGVAWFLTSNGATGTTSKGGAISVCVLNKTIKSGNKVTPSDVTIKTISKDSAPTDVVNLTVEAVAKIDLTPGTVLTAGMLNQTANTLTNDLREQEYNMIALPSKLTSGDFIDIRLQLPNGGDYIVVSKKQVLNCNASTVWLNMYEEEIELMSNAIIEYYIMSGSKLYATIYTDPGLQTASIGTYVPNQTVSALIASNPNVKNFINSERYAEGLKNIRNTNINSEINKYSEDAIKNIEDNMKDEIKTLKESRDAYFGALNSAN